MTVGERMKEIRKQLGMSQVDFADKINVSKQTLYKYENNIITNIPSDKIEAAARAANVSPSYLMGWDDRVNFDIFEELLATTDWSYVEYSHCGEDSDSCPFGEEERYDMLLEIETPEECKKCPQNKQYYYLVNGTKYYRFEDHEFKELSSCLRPYLLLRIQECIAKKKALSKLEYVNKELAYDIDDEEYQELLAAHERTDTSQTPDGKKHDLDIMKDDSEWE